MAKAVFNYSNYKDYLKFRLLGKGEKRAFSQFVGCQQSFLSQVLTGKPDLSLDHGLLANDYFEHTREEGKFFVLLMQLGRASSHRLRAHYQDEIKASLAEQRKLIKSISPEAKELSEGARGIYYSSWAIGAAHVLCSLARNDQISFLAGRLRLSKDELNTILRFLTEEGLIRLTGDHYRPSEKRVHIPATDPLVLSHHKNYRLRAIEEMHGLKDENLHYSILMTLSAADKEKVRELVVQLVKGVDEIVEPSNDETAVQLNLDLFEV